MQIKLPYGKGSTEIELPDNKVKAVLTSKVEDYNSDLTQQEMLKKALADPVESKKLSQLAKNKKEVVIISSDHTRPVPSKLITPLLLAEIRKGNPEAEITILVATGFHRASTKKELIAKYGKEIVENEKIMMHDSRREKDMVNLGILPSGGELILNKKAVEADLLVAEGFIEPHFFAGFSGGRKSVLPGVASKKTVLANHCAEFIDSPYARTGILENNPLHKDMIFAAEKIGLDFIINVVLNGDKEIIMAAAGNSEKAHLKGCQFLDSLAGVERKKADIVITTNGGYPLDQNIYQAVKGMTAAEALTNDEGIIIMFAKCDDGHGGESFYQSFLEAESPAQLMKEILKRDRKETVPDQWESQVLARILMKNRVILVSDLEAEMVENMYLKAASNFEEALTIAEKLSSVKQPEITIVPDGVGVIVRQ